MFPERAPLVRRAFEEYATSRFSKEQLLKQVRAWGLTNRRGRPLTTQAIGVLLRNRVYPALSDSSVRAFLIASLVDAGFRFRREGPREVIQSVLFAKARPEPDFKYRSKATALCSSGSSMVT